MQGRAKKFLPRSVSHVPSRLMGCESAALSWWVGMILLYPVTPSQRYGTITVGSYSYNGENDDFLVPDPKCKPFGSSLCWALLPILAKRFPLEHSIKTPWEHLKSFEYPASHCHPVTDVNKTSMYQFTFVFSA